MRLLASILTLALTTPALAAPRAAKAPKATTLTISVNNDRFIPAHVTMRRGQSYVLRLRNISDRSHNFSAPSFFKYARVAQRDSGWVVHNEVRLAPGQSATLHIVAPDTPNASYDFRSTRIADAAENMKGSIYVR